jgi:hypothetical protein
MEMAFRIEAAALAFLIAVPGVAQEYAVRGGLLRVSGDSITFQAAKHEERSRQWKLDDIRQLTLGGTFLRVQTYEGRNRKYVFNPVPRALAEKWYPVFSTQRDQRFVAALADERVHALWQVPVKLRRKVQGVLLVSADHVVFRATPESESRTWRICDIESVASAGRFDLIVTTREKEFRFDLKQALPSARYQELWRAVNRAQGLEILQ